MLFYLYDREALYLGPVPLLAGAEVVSKVKREDGDRRLVIP